MNWIELNWKARKGKERKAELEWLSVPLLKGKFLVQIQMFSHHWSLTKSKKVSKKELELELDLALELELELED